MKPAGRPRKHFCRAEMIRSVVENCFKMMQYPFSGGQASGNRNGKRYSDEKGAGVHSGGVLYLFYLVSSAVFIFS